MLRLMPRTNNLVMKIIPSNQVPFRHVRVGFQYLVLVPPVLICLLHCIDGREQVISQQIEDALDSAPGVLHRSRCVTASGYTHRRHRPRPCPLSVREPARSPAPSPRKPGPAALATATPFLAQ